MTPSLALNEQRPAVSAGRFNFESVSHSKPCDEGGQSLDWRRPGLASCGFGGATLNERLDSLVSDAPCVAVFDLTIGAGNQHAERVVLIE